MGFVTAYGDTTNQFGIWREWIFRSQLLSNNGESTRKSLKISVPHFDNSELIKSFSKMLIGRCMNPEEHDMKALITNIPTIWKLEDRVAGTDLGLGKFQFAFEREEFRMAPTYESIGDAIGRKVAVDVEHACVQVGEEALVSLRYEKIFGYCQICSILCHKDEKCPLDKKNTKKSPERKREIREGNGGWYDRGKHDDRARSYKGVVINGNGNQQNKDRESRDYYGKGKGKMFEEADSKWVKEFQDDLAKTHAAGTEVISDPIDEDEGLQRVQGLLKDPIDDEEDVMEMDEIKAAFLEHGIDMDVADDLPDFSEEETEGVITGHGEEEAHVHEGEDQALFEADKDATAAYLAKKQGTRKRLFKPTIATAGSTKMRVASALVSPRKRAAAKPCICHGENSKQLEIMITEFNGSGHHDKEWAEKGADWYRGHYKGAIRLNGVSLNTFIPLVARRYQREDFQTYEEVGRGVQPRMMGNGGFEMDLGLHLICSLRCGLPYLGPLIRSV
ncbi:hypothetical protein Bca101_074643 [Brassica carinata]